MPEIIAIWHDNRNINFMAHMLNKAFPNHIYHITEYKRYLPINPICLTKMQNLRITDTGKST